MQRIDLGGTDWTLEKADGSSRWPATVPGCVHTDLLEAGELPDPWYRDNEKLIHWVCLEDWTYRTTFQLDAEDLAHEHLTLRCDGLDTLAELIVNGQHVARTDNMFRTYRLDVKSRLRVGENELVVKFTSPIPFMKEQHARKPLPGWNQYHGDFLGKSHVRKMGCAFGWDWGLMAPTAGIWRDIELEAWNNRVEDVRITQTHEAEAVTVSIDVALDGRPTGTVRVTVLLEDEVVAVTDTEANASNAALEVSIEDPQLWWPNQLGDQPLYDVIIELLDGVNVVDTVTKRVGLRTLELIREKDEHGESFRFRCNGVDFFSKGANWIPCDVFPSNIGDETYVDLLSSAAESGMNMIRLWGGGIYEQQAFYDLCDELGLLIWHDFMFSCSTYPWWDAQFLENCRLEAIDNVRRVRHHASLALWCGNNEIEQGLPGWINEQPGHINWDDYKVLFDDILADVVREHDGVTPYWPSSGHTPDVDGHNREDHRDPTIGDAHAWSVWFGGEPFEAQRRWTFRFMSEFGFQSFPEPRTIETFTEAEDRSLTSWVMDYHQRSGPGNGTIFKYLLQWFPMPRDFEQMTWLSQLTQALCVQYAAEHARRIQGQMDGLMYWQLNDLWPGATWSSIDVFGRWKALQYFAKRFFAPVLVSLLENHRDSTVAIHVSNHLRDTAEVTVHYRIVDSAGTTLMEDSRRMSVPAQSNLEVLTVDCHDVRRRGGDARLPLVLNAHDAPLAGDRDVLVFAWVTDDEGHELSRNFTSFARPKYLKLQDPTFRFEVVADADQDGLYRVTVNADRPSPWTRLELEGVEGRWSDNFFHVAPGLAVHVELALPEAETVDAVQSRLRAVPLLAYGAS